MDLSGLKWPIIIAVVIGLGWLASSGGVNFMFKKFTSDQPGADAQKDATNEAGLSRLGGYCLMLMKYEKARDIFDTAVQRYPDGKNRLYNEYRIVRCAEKLGSYKRAADILKRLYNMNAHELDPRVPENDVIMLRCEKLIETHQLERR